MRTNRRDFLKTMGGIGLFSIVPAKVLGGPNHIAPSDQLTKGIIGVGGIGRSSYHFTSDESCRLVSVCDVDKNHLHTIDELNNAYWEVRNLNRQYEEQTVTADNPVDKTSLIVNPEHNDGTNGWGFYTPGVNYGVAEMYNQTFETYQSINDIPNGVYALTVRGFFRPYSSREAYKGFKPGTVVYGKRSLPCATRSNP